MKREPGAKLLISHAAAYVLRNSKIGLFPSENSLTLMKFSKTVLDYVVYRRDFHDNFFERQWHAGKSSCIISGTRCSFLSDSLLIQQQFSVVFGSSNIIICLVTKTLLWTRGCHMFYCAVRGKKNGKPSPYNLYNTMSMGQTYVNVK